MKASLLTFSCVPMGFAYPRKFVLHAKCTPLSLYSVYSTLSEYVQCELYALYSHRSLYIVCSSVVNYFTYTILSHIEYTGFSPGFFQGLVFMHYQVTKSSVCCKVVTRSAFLTNQVFTTDSII